MTLRLLLVRHGQTAWNASGRFMGHYDEPLDATGLQQASALAQHLRSERPLAIITSDLQRASQTAEALHAAICADLRGEPATEAPLLRREACWREMHFGAWQGFSYAELQAHDPAAMAAWEADLVHHTPPGGENLLDFAARIQTGYRSLLDEFEHGTVILVAHGGALQVLLTLALGLPPERYWQFGLSNTGWCELSHYPAGVILNRLNDCAHI